MGRAKVVYLDDYRKLRQHRNLLEMIEGHLAEAGRLGKYPSALRRSSQGGEMRWPLFDSDTSGK